LLFIFFITLKTAELIKNAIYKHRILILLFFPCVTRSLFHIFIKGVIVFERGNEGNKRLNSRQTIPVEHRVCTTKKNTKKLELCPKDTDAPTDNIYMVYSEKINKGP
jgi:hypothetical protein